MEKKNDDSWFPGGWGCFCLVLLFEIPKIWYLVETDWSSDAMSTKSKIYLVIAAIFYGLCCLVITGFSFSKRHYLLQPIISLLAIIAVALWTDLLGSVEFNLTWCYIIPLVYLAMVSIGILIVRTLYIRCNPKNVVLKALIQIVPLLIWGVILMFLAKI